VVRRQFPIFFSGPANFRVDRLKSGPSFLVVPIFRRVVYVEKYFGYAEIAEEIWVAL